MYFIAHGTLDSVVPMTLFSESCQVMTDKQKLGIPLRDIDDGPRPGLTVRVYEGMEHASDPRETLDLLRWLTAVLSSPLPFSEAPQ